MKTLIEKYEEEKSAMLECARLNPRETGNSIYMQMAIAADKKITALLNLPDIKKPAQP